jgi:hypothetical protein
MPAPPTQPPVIPLQEFPPIPVAVGSNETTEALKRMVMAWPAFAGFNMEGEIGGSLWRRIATEDSDGISPDIALAIDIIHRGGVTGEFTLAELAMEGQESTAGVAYLFKVYLYDDRSDPEIAKGRLVYLTDQLQAMLVLGTNAHGFGHANGSNYYGATFPPAPALTKRYHQKLKHQRWSEMVCTLDVVQEYSRTP